MKRIILLFTVILFQYLSTNAQTPNYFWAKSAGGTSSESGNSVATDANGNVYVTGVFNGSSITFGSITLTNAYASYNDIFIVKYDVSGNVLWAKSAGGSPNDKSNSIAVDANGNVFVTGYFVSSSITFGSTTLTNAGNYDTFIVKYDASGNVLWAKSAGGTGNEEGNSVATDINGNVYLTGYFSSSSITFGSTTLTNAGNEDIFIVKYDANGNEIWAKSAGGTSFDYSYGITTDASGNVFITGYFYSSSIIFGSTTLTNAGSYDMFIVKYDAAGNEIWAKKAGGAGSDYATSVVADANGNVYITGYFMSSSITFNPTVLTNAGGRDIFIAKYDNNGNVLWAKSAGGTGYESGNSVTVDVNANVYITGSFGSPSITFGSNTLTNAGSTDIFIVKYDNSGNVLWAQNPGGTSDEGGNCVAVDASGNVHITGYFSSSLITFGSFTLTNAGGYDMFIVQLNDCSILPAQPSTISGNLSLCSGTTHTYSISAVSGATGYTWSAPTGATINNGQGTTSISVTYGTNSGNVSVTADNGCGSSMAQTTSVTVNALPNNGVTQNGNTLTATEIGATYQWLDCNNSNAPISGVTSQNFTPTTNGDYAVEVTKNGCTDTSACINFVITGINDLETSFVKIYPNPITSEFIIELVNSFQDTQLSIVSIEGKTVYSSPTINTNKLLIDASEWSKGIYVVKITDKQSSEVVKLIKQ